MIRENVRKRDEKEKWKMLGERDSKRIFTGRRDFGIGERGLNSVTANEEDGELKSKGTAWVRRERDGKTQEHFADHS